MIYRYGGEELAIVLTETPLENSIIPLERLKDKISEHNFSLDGEDIKITVSIGVSANCEEAKTQKDLIEFADKALYKIERKVENIGKSETCYKIP